MIQYPRICLKPLKFLLILHFSLLVLQYLVINMCSETSPRISFSHDLGYTDDTPTKHNIPRRDTSLLESNSDFEFNISSSFEQESCSADELFANGMILSVQERMVAQKHVRKCAPPRLVSLPPLPNYPSKIESSKKESIKEIMVVNSDLEEKPQSKSFWKFKRSSSLNCDIKKSLVCSLPLLSRSNSTGSVSNSKKPMLKDSHKHNSQKQSLMSLARSSSSSSSSSLQKPPLKKNHGGAYGNGFKIIPVLNVPPPYISRGTANLFGLGSFLRNGKDKKSKK